MAIFKCKMCGGTLEINPGESVATCEYCGSQQTIPKLDDDRRANLYDRANHFRRNNEYDKAERIYEQILNEDPTDAEAYWSLVLCRYGIEYVEDPATHKRVPTVNRAQYTSIFDDDNYKSAIEHADTYQRTVYDSEAKTINEIQKGILAISQKEEPFDVFICYKETDNSGRRTRDSVLANDLYHQLIQEGFKVFFSRITLEDKLGTAYEPYIFAALNSAKVMVVLGTKPEYFNAVWVKNEWSRYLALVNKSGGKKVLIPAYRDMDPYDLPEEFSHLQAQDMSKLGFMQDLIRGIKKIAKKDEPKPAVVEKQTVSVSGSGNANVNSLLKRVAIFLEDGDWNSADEYCEKVLDIDPENAEAYLGKLMAEIEVSHRHDLKDCRTAVEITSNNNYKKVIRFGSEKIKNELDGYLKYINDRNAEEKRRQEQARRRKEEERRRQEEENRKQEEARKEAIYSDAVKKMNMASNVEDYQIAVMEFDRIIGFKDSAELYKKCQREAAQICSEADYAEAKSQMNAAVSAEDYNNVAKLFRNLSGFKDADDLVKKCEEQAEGIRKDEVLSEANADMGWDTLERYDRAKEKLKSVRGWKDANEKLAFCEKRMKEITAEYEEAAKIENKKKKKRLITIGAIAAAVIALVVVFLIVLNTVIIPKNLISEAKNLADEGKYPYAARLLMKAGLTDETKPLFWDYMRHTRIATSSLHTVGLKSDGTVVAAGSGIHKQMDVSGWKNIVAIAAEYDHTVGLKSDGTVVAVGNNDCGQCNVSGWKDIVAVAAGGTLDHCFTVGLKSDGTVVATGDNENGQCNVSGWEDIVAISAADHQTVGLKADGTVIATGLGLAKNEDFSDWKDIVAISAGNQILGLKSNGTVIVAGEDSYENMGDAKNWKNMASVASKALHSVGVKTNGDVVAVGRSDSGECNVTMWDDVVAVCVENGHTIGLKSDGTVVSVGKNDDGECDIDDWKLW